MLDDFNCSYRTILSPQSRFVTTKLRAIVDVYIFRLFSNNKIVRAGAVRFLYKCTFKAF